MLVGQGGDKKTVTAPPPAMTAPAPVAVSSGCGCDPCGCEGFGHRLRHRLGGLFNRNNCDSCQPSTCAPACAPAPACNTCQSRIVAWQPRSHSHNACAPATSCDSCGNGHVGIFERLRGSFARGGSSCCDGGCSSGGCGNSGYGPGAGGTIVPPAKGSEPIVNPPKKLPVEKVPAPVNPPPAKKAGSVSIETHASPATPNTISVAPSIPSVELAPAPAPRVEGDRRDPF
jgi:hypothetical protein